MYQPGRWDDAGCARADNGRHRPADPGHGVAPGNATVRVGRDRRSDLVLLAARLHVRWIPGVTVGSRAYRPEEAPNVAVVSEPEIQTTEKISDYPVVEKVHKPDVTVLTMNISDPKIKVVWFFDDNLKM